jgi:hypothetical protein
MPEENPKNGECTQGQSSEGSETCNTVKQEAAGRRDSLREQVERSREALKYRKELQRHLLGRWRNSELSRQYATFDYKEAIQIFVATETPPTAEEGDIDRAKSIAKSQLDKLQSQYPKNPLRIDDPLSTGRETKIPSFGEFAEWYQTERHLYISERLLPKDEYRQEKRRVEAFGESMAEGRRYLQGDIQFFEENIKNADKDKEPKELNDYIRLKKESIIRHNLASADPEMVDIIRITQGKLPNPSPQTLEALYRLLENEEKTNDFRQEWEQKKSRAENGTNIEEKERKKNKLKQELWFGIQNGKGKMDLFTVAMLEFAREAKTNLEQQAQSNPQLKASLETAEKTAGEAGAIRPQRIEETLFSVQQAEGDKRVGILGNFWGFLGYGVGTLWVAAVGILNTMTAWQQGQGFEGFIQNVVSNPYIAGSIGAGYVLQKVADRAFTEGSVAMKYFQEQDITDWKSQFFGDPNECALLGLVNWESTNVGTIMKEIEKEKAGWNEELEEAQERGERTGQKTKPTNELSAADFCIVGKDGEPLMEDEKPVLKQEVIRQLFGIEKKEQAISIIGRLLKKDENESFKVNSPKMRRHFWKQLAERPPLRENLASIHDIAKSYNRQSIPRFETL